MADVKDSYILALEKKLAELSGINVDQIHKNQLANAASEASAIKQMADYVGQITVRKQAQAASGSVNPIIQAVFDHIKDQLGEEKGMHKQGPLPYTYDALEPYINSVIMEIHYSKHHIAYINNLMTASEKLLVAENNGDIQAQNALIPAIVFNGGGHVNHSIFWENMAPSGKPSKMSPNGGGGLPTGELAEAIKRDFGSFDEFKAKFSTESIVIKGSGWGWLAYDPVGKKLHMVTTQNQDPVYIVHGYIPLLGLDVWEHAYYLQYKNLRGEYVKAFFNVINWDNVAKRYELAQQDSDYHKCKL